MNEREIQSLLALAAKRLHTTPEALRAAAENGDQQENPGTGLRPLVRSIIPEF